MQQNKLNEAAAKQPHPACAAEQKVYEEIKD